MLTLKASINQFGLKIKNLGQYFLHVWLLLALYELDLMA